MTQTTGSKVTSNDLVLVEHIAGHIGVHVLLYCFVLIFNRQFMPRVDEVSICHAHMTIVVA